MVPVRVFQQDGKTHLIFNAQLNVSHARALHAQLGQVLDPSLALVLEAGQVEQVDTAALQVLAGFCRQVQAQGNVLHWQSVSPALRQAGQLLGLDSLFGDLT